MRGNLRHRMAMARRSRVALPRQIVETDLEGRVIRIGCAQFTKDSRYFGALALNFGVPFANDLVATEYFIRPSTQLDLCRRRSLGVRRGAPLYQRKLDGVPSAHSIEIGARLRGRHGREQPRARFREPEGST